MKKEPSLTTKLKVYERWKGKCAFCGVSGTIEQHHIIPKSEATLLINDFDNLVLLCNNHHALTRKVNPNGKSVISFREIQDVANSKYVDSDKFGVYFDVPQNDRVVLGSNFCISYSYILVVNKKPLIELWKKPPAHYVKELRFFVTMRFFDEDNNFLGGMFDNHWAYVVGENWDLSITADKIEITHKTRSLFVKIEKKESLHITGVFYFDGIRIEAKDNALILPGDNRMMNNTLEGCAFSVFGDRQKSGFIIGGVQL